MSAIRVVTRSDREEWDRSVAASDADCVLFLSSYMDYHADRFKDASLLAVLGDGRLAAFPASINEGKVISHAGLTFGDLQLPPGVSFTEIEATYRAIVDHYLSLGVSALVIKQTPECFLSQYSPQLIPALKLSKSIEHDGAAVDLRRPLVVTAKRRPRVQRAMLSHSFREESLPSFWPLLESVLSSRHDVRPVHTEQEMASLMQGAAGRIRIFGARKDGRLLAGAVLYLSRHAVHVQYMATNDEGRNTHALDALLFWLMERHSTEVSWFSMGISNERDGSLNQGLFDYKMSFGAVRIAHVTNEYALS
jgi:hypothetical protein